jgi:phospholipase C
VAGDLTSVFNFVNPNDAPVNLPSTAGFPPSELDGGSVPTFHPALAGVIVGVPPQEKGIRPARALPYELDVHATVNASNSTIRLTFFNTGAARGRGQTATGDARGQTKANGSSLVAGQNKTDRLRLIDRKRKVAGDD